MKNNLRSKIVFAGCLFFTFSGQSQVTLRSDHNQHAEKIYVVTDSIRNGAKWNLLRTLDENTGSFSNILFRLLTNNELQPPQGTSNMFTSNGVAAIALDQKNKKLYYTPMLTDKLYYLDLRTMNRTLVTGNFSGLMPKTSDQGNIITRMVIGEDDKGYALTNDGRHLIRFRTNNNNPGITDLGTLVDAPGNNEMSVHNLCSSFGGDLVADDDGHLYLITSRNHVFKIKIQTKVARYIGTITNLPANFITSGTAVNKSGEKIILVSSVDSSDVYVVRLRNLVANRIHANRPWLASDLANDEILESENHHGHADHRIVINDNAGNDNIQLYPNPVTAKEFKIHFTDTRAGIYTVGVMNADGSSIMTKAVNTGGKENIISIKLPEIISSGIYIVKITDSNNKPCYTGKIFVQ
jgi:Secretion system C-terminal sorting domain